MPARPTRFLSTWALFYRLYFNFNCDLLTGNYCSINEYDYDDVSGRRPIHRTNRPNGVESFQNLFQRLILQLDMKQLQTVFSSFIGV